MKFLVVLVLGVALFSASLFISLPSGNARVSAGPVDNWVNFAALDWEEGDGSYENPWIVSSPALLALMAQQVNTIAGPGPAARIGFFLITEDIDLADHYWTPIGTSALQAQVFRGTLSALPGVEIKNMTVNSLSSTAGNAGFFGTIGTGSTIQGLNFVNADVHGTLGAGAGILAGQIQPSNAVAPETIIRDITVCGDSVLSTIGGDGIRTGGIIGNGSGAQYFRLTIEDIEMNATIKSESNGTGGILGQSTAPNQTVTIDNVIVNSKFELEAPVSSGGVVGSFGPSNNFGVSLSITNSLVDIDIVWNGGNGQAMGGVIGSLVSSINLNVSPFTHTSLTIKGVEVRGNVDFVGGWANNRGRLVGAVQGVYNHVIIEDVVVNQFINNHPTAQWSTWVTRPSVIPAGMVSTFIGWMPTNAAQIAASQNIIDIRQVASIAFNTGVGGDTVTALPFIYNTIPSFTFTLPNTIPVVSNGNYNFLGWSRSQNNIVAYDPGDIITITNPGTTTLHAVTDQIMHTITFNSQGNVYATRSIGQGDDLIEWIVPAISPASHTFSHWANYVQGTTPPGTVIEFREGDTLAITEPLTLHAHWTANTYDVYVRWLPNTDTQELLFSHVHGTALPATLTSIHDRGAGFYFDGLRLQNGTEIFDGDGNRAFTAGWNITGEQLLHAHWGRNTFNINFDPEGGTTVSSISGEYEATLIIPADPTRNGHTFLGWAITSGDAVVYEEGDDVTVHAEHRTLFARWQIHTYTITFNVGAGTTVSSVSQNFGTMLVLVAPTHVSTLANHDFLGWATSQTRADEGYVDYEVGEDEVEFTSNRTLWAVRILTQFAINFETRGGTVIDSVNRTHNQTLVLTTITPTLDNYHFAGWATTEQRAIDGYIDHLPTAVLTITQGITIWAVWQEQFTLEFNTGYGSHMGNIIRIDGTTFTFEGVPNREGYTFLGWAVIENGEVVHRIGDTITISGDLTLFAVWQVIPSNDNGRNLLPLIIGIGAAFAVLVLIVMTFIIIQRRKNAM